MSFLRYLMVIAAAAFALANLAGAAPRSCAAEPVQAGAKTKDITFDTIKFDIKKGQKFKREMLTEAIEGLKTQKVKLRGYMFPTFQQSGITKFVLVRDNMECCFGPGAMIYDCVMVEMAEGKSTDFSVRPIAVEGTFDVKPIDDGEGNLLSLYYIKGDGVK